MTSGQQSAAPPLPGWLRLRCPECSAGLVCDEDACRCERSHLFRVRDGIPHLVASALGAPRAEYVRWIHDYYRVPFSPRQQELSRRRFERLLALMGPQPPVLDVGCGRADKSAAFPAGQYVGVDQIDPIAAGMIARAPAPIVVARGERLPFEDGQFGSAMLWAVLDQVLDRPVLLSECARVLRPGGRLCIMTQVMGERGGLFKGLLRWILSRVRTGDLRGMIAIARFTYADPRTRAYLTPLTSERARAEVSERFTDIRSELLDGHTLLLRATR